MYRSDSPVRRLFGLAVLLLALTVVPASAQQTASSVMEDAGEKMRAMFANVDHYKTVTGSFTTYTRKVTKDGDMAFESATRGTRGGQNMGGSVASPFSQYDGIGRHGTLIGSESVNGITCHVIRVDDPQKIDPNMGQAESVSYFIGKDDYLVHRMVMEGVRQGNQSEMTMTMTMKGYKNWGEGLMFPAQMEMQISGMDPQMKERMEQMKKQMEQMPEAQRKRMEKMMGQASSMMSGEPTVIEVEEVEVNGELPDGVFN